MRPGAKREVTAPPLDLSDLPPQRGRRAVAFIGRYVITPKGEGARRRFRLRPWQARIVREALAPRVRQGLLALPRGNGKSTLAAALGVFGLFEGVEGAQVLIVATDERQAGIIRNTARRMIELNPVLAERVVVWQDKIVEPRTDSMLISLPADPAALQGWDPTLAIVDELHVVKEPVWDAMALAAGKRDRSLVLAISTASDSKDSVMWRLLEHGRSASDPSFYLAEFTAPDDHPVDCEHCWRQANPALGDFLAVDGLRSTLRTTRPEVFARYRLNRWVGQVGSWLPWDAWDEVADPSRIIDPDEPIVIGFDGSITDDSTALVGCTVARPHHLFVVRMWERDEPGWRVPRAEVAAAVDAAVAAYNVQEISADPWHWETDIQLWNERHGRVVSWPSNALARMAPATDRLRTAVMEQTVSHDGNADLARHVRNAVAKSTALGDVVVKDRRGSPRKIDGLVAALIAFDRANWHATRPAKRRRMVVV